jgi:hypothetical protein
MFGRSSRAEVLKVRGEEVSCQTDVDFGRGAVWGSFAHCDYFAAFAVRILVAFTAKYAKRGRKDRQGKAIAVQSAPLPGFPMRLNSGCYFRSPIV